MQAVCEISAWSRSLPQVIGKDSQPGPDSGRGRAPGQHTTQTKLAFKHTDRGFYTAAKALQVPEPSLSLLSLFCSAQATHFRDSDFFNAGPAELQHVIHAVVSSVGRHLLGLNAETGFCLAQHRN